MHRNVIFIALILSIVLLRAAAQTNPPSTNLLGDPDLFAGAHIHGLDALVHLSDEQKRNLYPVFYTELRMAIAIMSDASLRDDQKGEQIQQVHKRTAAKIDSILTPDQRKALEPPSTDNPVKQPPAQT